jgi:hypothetical protein
MQVGMADATCGDFDQHFASAERGHRDFFDS